MTSPEHPDSSRRAWIDAAWAELGEAEAAELVADLVDVPSPTGEEDRLARVIAARLGDAGVDAWVQPIDDLQSNAVGCLAGAGDGPGLLLYAPIDTLTVGIAAEDVPMAGRRLRDDQLAAARAEGPVVVGLAASNPKGHAVAVILAGLALRRAGVELAGDLWLGFGAGGMPTHRTTSAGRRNTGQGVGCSYLLEQGVHPDFAVIAKPGWGVTWEEVGLCWFDVTVHGDLGYVGSRHRIPAPQAVVGLGTVIGELEAWCLEYGQRPTRSTLRPQALIGAVQAGWQRMASIAPATATARLDVRIAPGQTPATMLAELRRVVAAIADRSGVTADVEMVLAIPGTATHPENWIVRSAIGAWELVEGRTHEPVLDTSGATDANILRSRGVPTARVGMPKLADAGAREVDFSLGMNAVSVPAVVQLARHLVATAVDTCTRTRGEVGLR